MTLSPVRMLENPATVINMNCVDPLGRWAVIGQNITILTSDWLSRTALLMAIDNENMEMLELLLENKVTRSIADTVILWGSTEFCSF